MLRNAVLVLVWGSVVLATDCYTDCKDRFPKWFQEPDRLRCAAEKSKACLKPSGLPGPVSLREFDSHFADYSRRLEKDFLEGGYVVSRNRRGEPMHQGDSLLWTSLAMASLSCRDAAPIRHALVNSIHRNGGRLIRFDPLPNDCKGNETSRDAEIGALFGFTIHSLRCPEAKAELAEAWRLHYDFVKAHSGRLHEGSNPNFLMNPALNFVWDLVSHHFLGTARPGNVSLAMFEAGTTINTTAIHTQKSACYPIHLSTLLLVTAVKLGKPVNHLTRREFCHDTRGMNLPLTEWYCDRGNVREFLDNYRPNVWEYRHQRCPGWESPDVDSGDTTPGIDFLMHKMLGEMGH